MDNDDMIRQARQGDESAWRDLIDEHQQVIFRLAYLILGDPDEAKDIAQETFIQAYVHFDTYDVDKPLRPWLYRIAANLAYNHRRSWGRRWKALKRFWWVRPEREENPETLSFEQLQAETLREAVTRLKQKDQTVIYYHYFLDLSIEETARALDLASGTVKSRLHWARKRLYGVIQREYPSLQKGMKDD